MRSPDAFVMPPSYISQRRQLIRSFYSGIGKSGIIIPAAFVVALAMGLVALGLIFYAREVLHASPSTIGLLAGTISFAYILGCFAVRPALSMLLPCHLVAGSVVVMAACALAMQRVQRIHWVFLLYAVYGLSVSTFWPPLMGWLSDDVEGKELGRAVNRFNVAWCMGNVISPFLCGRLSDTNPVLPLRVASVVLLLTALFVFAVGRCLPVESRTHAGHNEPTGRGETGAEKESVLRYPAWLGLFFCFFASGTVAAVFPLHGIEWLGFSKSMIGGVLLVRGLLNVVGFIVLGRTQFWHFKAMPMLSAQLLAGCLFVALAFAGTAAQITPILAGFGLAAAMAYSASIFHGASGSRNRAGRMAIHESILAFGVMTGSIVGGMIFQAASAGYAYGLCGILLMLSVTVQALMCRKAAVLNRPG